MINIDTQIKDINSIELIDNSKHNSRAVKKKSKIEQNKEDNATKVELSHNIMSKIDSIISKEDILVQNLDSVQYMYESLTNIRIKIAELMQKLQDTDENDITTLENLDTESNILIDNVVSLVKNDTNLAFSQTGLMNFYLDGLLSFKDLNIRDENYLIKLRDTLVYMREKENFYYNLGEDIYANLQSLSKDFENNVQNIPNFTGSQIKNGIVKNSTKTIQATTSKIDAQKVSYLLKNIS